MVHAEPRGQRTLDGPTLSGYYCTRVYQSPISENMTLSWSMFYQVLRDLLQLIPDTPAKQWLVFYMGTGIRTTSLMLTQ